MRERLATAASCLATAALAAGLLARPIATFAHGLWGPEHPWSNFDFVGAYWLFEEGWKPGATARLGLPDMSLPLRFAIPNPWDGLMLGPLLSHLPFPAWWNGMQLFHHLANVAATTWLARAARARPHSAVAGAALVAASPVMLHEVAGGRPITSIVWPGLCALALLLRGRPAWAGLLLGVQGLCYLYTGLVFGIVALLIRPAWGLLWAAVPLVPYAVWLWPVRTALHGLPPPAGYTSLPVAGLLGLAAVPERFHLNPALLCGLAVPLLLRAHWRWLAAATFTLLVALGPVLTWTHASAGPRGPLAWVFVVGPAAARMHHPVRAALVLVPLLGVLVALGLDRLPRWTALAPLGLALALRHSVELAAPWNVDVTRPGEAAARWLASHGTAVVDLTGANHAALGLQPVHGLAMLEGLRPIHQGRAGALAARVAGWLRGERQPGLAAALHEAGFSHVLAVNRFGEPPITAEVQSALTADLGPPVYPGVWAIP